MAGYIRYKILPELKIIIECYCGKINLELATEHKKKEIQDPKYNANYNFIADLKDAELEASDKDVKGYVDFLKIFTDVIGQRKSAILTNTPMQVAITTILKDNSKDMPVNYGIFSTLIAAVNFVDLPNHHYDEIEKIIENLKK